MVIAFNKIDILPSDFAEEWMRDFEAYQNALDVDGKEDYMGMSVTFMNIRYRNHSQYHI